VGEVLYFAYGSNMDPGTMRGRRGIEWKRATAAVTRGWKLAFDKPSLLGTREGMATLVADAAAETWGVLYEISAADLEHIEFTEGVKIDHYVRVTVVVQPSTPWDGRHEVEAVTLASDHRDPAIRPTTRYMRLLLAGAAEHGLPPWWIDALARVEAVEESAESAAMRPMFEQALKRPS
jgi:gamma-glutamylcyclotransferase